MSMREAYWDSVDEDVARRLADLDGKSPEYYWDLLHTPEVQLILERQGFYEVKDAQGEVVRRFEFYR